MKLSNAFITGSRAHGTPRADSDIDLVILVSSADAKKLGVTEKSRRSLRFGELNLIVIQEQEKFDAWKKVNDHLVSIGPVTREKAVQAYCAAGVTGNDYGKAKKYETIF